MIPKSFHPITTREKYCKRVAGKSINISVKAINVSVKLRPDMSKVMDSTNEAIRVEFVLQLTNHRSENGAVISRVYTYI